MHKWITNNLSDKWPHLVMKIHSHTLQKMIFWDGILGNYIVGPFLIQCNISRDAYLNLLQECVDPMSTDIFRNNDNIIDN